MRADIGLMRRLVERLGLLTTLKEFEEADHSFHVPAHRTHRCGNQIRNVGCSRQLVGADSMSAFGGKADIRIPLANVRS